jgi:hypothetical protein
VLGPVGRLGTICGVEAEDIMRGKAEGDGVEPIDLSARQWDALGEMRRLEGLGLTLAWQVGGVHLATLKPLQACGLLVITESPGRDRNSLNYWP